jgi:hypothetical protein
MARAQWPLQFDRPAIEIILTLALGGQKVTRTLLADTGAGNAKAPFDLLLEENDCLLYGGKATHLVPVTGAHSGSYPLYVVRVQIPTLGFDDDVAVIGVPTPPSNLDGIACFRFLNRFTYGNFGNAGEFGLET